MKQAKQKTRFGTVLLVFGASVLLILFGVFPLVRGIVKGSAELENIQTQLQKAAQEENDAREFQRFKARHGKDVADLERLFIHSVVPIEFIEFLENAGEQAGMSLSIAPGTGQQQEDLWPSAAFLVSGRGSYVQLTTMLRLLENAPYLIEVRDARIQKESTGVLSFSLTVKAFTR
ncbi:MAG: hypothetical protein Q8P39_03235 [Candidatus Yanofskybacteria bacterium]|nr:hypothetical protein [Candidatus Yanofskybacteria bacterium]